MDKCLTTLLRLIGRHVSSNIASRAGYFLSIFSDAWSSPPFFLQFDDYFPFFVSFSLVLNIKTFFKTVAVVSTAELLLGWSISDQLVTAINTCVLPPGTSLVNLTDGCLCLTVQAESLSALTTLWNLYQDGTLKRRLYDFFVTDEVKEQAGGETVEVNVSIEEDEYDKACRELISEARGNLIL